LAIGLGSEGLLLRGAGLGERRIDHFEGQRLSCPTSLSFADPTKLIVCLGSDIHPPQRWKHDLLEKNSTGSIWEYDVDSGRARRLADGLGYPYGAIGLGNGDYLYAESWRSRVKRAGKNGEKIVLDDLPFYPSRLAASDRGILLCGFAPRFQLFEFILREPVYKKRMMVEVPEQYWMAPAIGSGDDYREPIQNGQIRHHGISKPWAPTKSYGLLVLIDAEGRVLGSAHCRADGRRHGITSAVALNGRVYLTSKASGEILSLAALEEA
jgi:hypothetical protein